MTRIYGVGLVGALFLYIGFSLWWDARAMDAAATLHGEEAEEIAAGSPDRPWLLVGAIVAGLTALVFGSRLAVTGATGLARGAGISEEVIGLTLIAAGTSLPELATALVAARRGHSDVCVGNVIGSNIFNLLGIAGAAAIAAPLPFSREIVSFDIWALLALTLILIVFMLTGRRVQRWEGGVLLALYVIYLLVHFRPAGAAGP